ncbi:MAG TPA: Asp-tRNA(Asn)/Glu-tRNA(Gln) amidotransferase subunit GatB [bacterium]|nr:Asp-tRNA(Asn)/Glu-tRNA(Gln) amidotransferase subunit GatB [bacterium]
MEYQAVIGLEVHAQLNTKSKLFCSCSTEFAADPNHHVCPVCLGFPGVLPVLNKKAIDFVIQTCLAFNCETPSMSRFARKNYYYPDLPKAYQISQYELPLGVNGKLDINVGGKKKTIRIHRIHLEEDAGKLVHLDGGGSCVDYNRTGIPLMEIVSEADIASSDEAVAYLTALRSVLQYLGVCEANMEKGEMRCEPNISVMPVGSKTWGTKTELKNLNSFRAVQRGIDFEIERQIDLIEDGGRVIQETRRWDDTTQTTQSMRTKEHAHDYRYFPDPDLVPVEIDPEWITRLSESIPELPVARASRLVSQFGLPEYDARVLTDTKPLADYFENVASLISEPKLASNWIMTELLGRLNEQNTPLSDCKITPAAFAALLNLISSGKISARTGKDVFKEMFASGADPEKIVSEKNLIQVSDESEIAAVVARVIAENPGPVADLKAGKEKAIGFLVGKVMAATKGKANPGIVNKLLKDQLS